MANEYHDAQGRFCGKRDMQNAIRNLASSGDHEGAQKLIADLKRIEEKRERKGFVAHESSSLITRSNGKREWWVHGKFHREDGPAVEYPDGTREWFWSGQRHRVDGPAIEHPDGTREWWAEDKLHRENGPAVEYADGSYEWYMNGERHRVDGPAVEATDGTRQWWVDGKRLSEAEFNVRQQSD